MIDNIFMKVDLDFKGSVRIEISIYLYFVSENIENHVEKYHKYSKV